VRFFAFIMNRMTKSNLRHLDGYRALRVTMLADVVDRLASSSTDVRTAHHLPQAGLARERSAHVWHERNSGETKKARLDVRLSLRARRLRDVWRER